MRAVPPHLIQSNGIGPYLLGTDFKTILSTLPHGPRVEVIQIEHVVAYRRLVRVAQDAILVGIGQAGKAAFIAALDPDIAKTADGWSVGSEIDSLREALGPERPVVGARDPSLVELNRLPDARVIVAGHRVAAIVVGPDDSAEEGRAGDLGPADALSGGGTGRPAGNSARPRASAPAADTGGCTVASAIDALAGEPVVETARVEDAKDAAVHYGCFTGTDPEAVVADEDQLILVVGGPGHLRRAATASVPGLRYANVADVDGDGRHDLVAVSEDRSSEAIAIRVTVLRGDGGRLVEAADEEVYRLTADAALPVAKLKDIQLLIDAEADRDGLAVGGLYLQWDGDDVRSLAPLIPQTIELGTRKRSGNGPASGSGGAADADGGRDDEHGAAASTRGGPRPRARPSQSRRSTSESR
ncbi:MAG TPA: hypothetical protein VKB80_30765 [Kofleriaceae bacterium]|nr:hypothetical protein [Kofleriaceae bacterium]